MLIDEGRMASWWKQAKRLGRKEVLGYILGHLAKQVTESLGEIVNSLLLSAY
jgi:hypothetical protein